MRIKKNLKKPKPKGKQIKKESNKQTETKQATKKTDALPKTQPCFFTESMQVCILTVYSLML